MAINVVSDFTQCATSLYEKFASFRQNKEKGSSESALESLRVVDLKALLKEKRLSQSGLKADLIARLTSSSATSASSSSESDSNTYSIQHQSGVTALRLEPHQKKPFLINTDLYERLSSALRQQGKPESLIYCLLARYEALEGVISYY